MSLERRLEQIQKLPFIWRTGEKGEEEGHFYRGKVKTNTLGRKQMKVQKLRGGSGMVSGKPPRVRRERKIQRGTKSKPGEHRAVQQTWRLEKGGQRRQVRNPFAH